MNTLLADRIIKTFKSLNLKPSSLHEPTFKGNEIKYLKKCIETGYVSSVGEYVNTFEKKIKSNKFKICRSCYQWYLCA